MKSIEKGSGNIYADLRYPDATQMQIKARLAVRIGELIENRGITQTQAAAILALSQPKLSGLLRGSFRGISEIKMLDCLNRLGQDVNIVIKKSARSAPQGATRVVIS